MRGKNKHRAQKHASARPAGRFFKPYGAVFTLLLFAFLVRLGALLALKKSVYFGFLLWDERIYHTLATHIANGTYQATTVYEFSPLPAYVMALLYTVLSPDIMYVRVANLCFGTLTCYLVHRLGKELVNQRVGLMCGFMAALYEPFILYSIVPLKTALSVFLFALMIFLFMTLFRSASFVRMLFLGIAMGLALNTRGNVIVLIPALLAPLLWHMYGEGASVRKLAAIVLVYLVGLSLAIMPFAMRNYRVAGEWALTSSNTGYNLYLGNNLNNPDPYYRPVPFASSSPFEQGVQFTIEASRRVGKRLSPQEASSYWTQEVIKTAVEEPAAFVWKMCQKAAAVFHRFEAGDHYNIDFISRFVPFFQLPFVRFGWLLPFALAGMAMTVTQSRKCLSLSFVSLLYGATLCLFFTNARYRLPLVVMFIPLAIIGIQHLFSKVQEKHFQNIAIYCATVLLGGVMTILPLQATDDRTAYYNTHALILNAGGREQEALRYWEQSSQMNRPFSAFANLPLARKYAAGGDGQQARAYLDKIPDQSFAAAFKYELLGDTLLKEGNTTEAISAYEQSLVINSGRRRVRQKLVRIFRTRDAERAKQEERTLQYISAFYTGL